MAKIVHMNYVEVRMTQKEVLRARCFDGVLNISEPNEIGVRTMWYEEDVTNPQHVVDALNAPEPEEKSEGGYDFSKGPLTQADIDEAGLNEKPSWRK